MSKVIEIENLTKSYGKSVGLRGFKSRVKEQYRGIKYFTLGSCG